MEDVTLTPKNVISTFTGLDFNVVEPKESDIKIEDIAHALSLMCRANGHFNQFYSVAQHSMSCCKEAKARGLSKEIQLCCLLHDASEAYLCDIPRPIKDEAYKKREEALEKVIFKALAPQVYDLFFEEHSPWIEIDDVMLYWEFETFFKTKEKRNPIPKSQNINIELRKQVVPFDVVRTEFLMMYNELVRGMKN